MPTDPDPVRCECGAPSMLWGSSPMRPWCNVKCDRINQHGGAVCWEGPRQPTPELAILAWNSVMEAARAAKEQTT